MNEDEVSEVDGLCMIPPFTEAGLLPPGVHSANRKEFAQRFVASAPTAQRVDLFRRIELLFDAAERVELVRTILFAGSFVTTKPDPDDFDCLIVINAAASQTELRPFEYQVVSRSAARKQFRGDIFPVIEGSEQHRHFTSFFQITRDGNAVGVVEIHFHD